MRISPTPRVSAKEMPPVRVQALSWLTIRARRSAGVDSMKLTVSWTPLKTSPTAVPARANSEAYRPAEATLEGFLEVSSWVQLTYNRRGLGDEDTRLRMHCEGVRRPREGRVIHAVRPHEIK